MDSADITIATVEKEAATERGGGAVRTVAIVVAAGTGSRFAAGLAGQPRERWGGENSSYTFNPGNIIFTQCERGYNDAGNGEGENREEMGDKEIGRAATIPKQYQMLSVKQEAPECGAAGWSVLELAIAAFVEHPGVDLVLPVLNTDHRSYVAVLDGAAAAEQAEKSWVIQDKLDRLDKFDKAAGQDKQAGWNKLLPPLFLDPHLIPRRQDSARHGLAYLRQMLLVNPSASEGVADRPGEHIKVLIHDGARPLVSHNLISRVIAALEQHQAVDVGMPLVDSLRQRWDYSVAGDAARKAAGISAVDRRDFYAVQTPQGFYLEEIAALHQKYAAASFDDDIALYLAAGLQCGVVEGESSNFKITNPVDLEIAKVLLNYKQKRV